ncbi:MAG: phosphatase PAP2 family protein [Patescibacteria group bacterium]
MDHSSEISVSNKPLLPIIVTILVGSLLAFAVLALSVANGFTVQADQAILQWINQFSSPALDTFFVAFTQLGGVIVVTLVTLIIFGYLLYKKQYPKAVLIAAGVGGVSLLNFILKSVFERSRPDLWTWIITETNYSFPSGHSAASAALAMSIVIILWNTKWRSTAIIAGAVYVFIIGLSRMYLGVHFPSDVIGGWLLATTWMMTVTLMIYLFTHRNSRKKLL